VAARVNAGEFAQQFQSTAPRVSVTADLDTLLVAQSSFPAGTPTSTATPTASATSTPTATPTPTAITTSTPTGTPMRTASQAGTSVGPQAIAINAGGAGAGSFIADIEIIPAPVSAPVGVG
jgi:hypothetical protein